jgi:hypothetical protein
MGAEKITSLGREEKLFVSEEASWATFVKPVSADAIDQNAPVALSYSQERAERLSKQPETRSLMTNDLVTRRKELSWSIPSDIIPSGTAGTPPDVHLLLQSAFGDYTNTPATSDEYSLDNSQQLPSVQITREISQLQMNVHQGSWVDEVVMSWSGAEEGNFLFSGGSKDEIHTFRAQGTTAGGDNVIQLDLGAYDDYFQVNSVVAILKADGTLDSNAGVGYQVNDVNTTLHRLLLDAVVVAAYAGRPIVPFTPAKTTVGTPVTGIVGTLTIGGAAYRVISASITLNNGTKALNDEFGYDGVSDYLMGPRRITGTLQFRMYEDSVALYPDAKAFERAALVLTSGSLTAGGSRVVLSCPNIELTPFNIDAPESEEVVVDASFMALASVAENEMTLTFD